MPLNLAPVNLAAGVTQNPLMQIGQALAELPNQQVQAQLQNQQIGKQLMAPYLKMLYANQDNENNQSVMGPLNFLSKKYGIPIAYTNQQDDTPTSPSASGQPQQVAPIPGAPPVAQTPPGPGAAMSIGGPASQPPGGVATPPIPGVVPGAQTTPGSPVPPQQQAQPPAVQQAAPAGSALAAPPVVPGAPEPPAAQGGPSRRVIDPTWLMGQVMDPDVIAKGQSMDPAQRKDFYKLQGIDTRWLPKSFLSSPQQITPGEKATATSAFAREIEGVAEGKNTIASLQAIGEAYRPILGDAAVDAALNNPQNLDKMGNALVERFNALRQAGVWHEDQYKAAMDRVQAAQARNATYQEMANIQEDLLPHRTALMDAQSKHALADAAAAHTRLMPSNASSGLSRSQIASNFAQAKRAYDQLQVQIGRASSYKDPLTGRPEKTQPPDEILDAAQDAGSDLDYWTDQMHEAGMPVKPRDGYQSSDSPSVYSPAQSPTQKTAAAALHKNGIQTVTPPGLKPVATDKNNKTVYQDASGNYVYADRTPYKPQ